jgi:hypothetical protein
MRKLGVTVLVLSILLAVGCGTSAIVGSYTARGHSAYSLRINEDHSAVTKDANSGRTWRGTYKTQDTVILIMWEDGTKPDKYLIRANGLFQQLSNFLYTKDSE